jgi:hypothetical protein
MARQAVTPEFYEALVAAYRENPGAHSHAASTVGCDRRTAKRGWEEGWQRSVGHGRPALPWARPIRDVIADEQAEARRRLAAIEEREHEVVERERALRVHIDREKVRQEAVQRRTEWAAATQEARRNAHGVARVVGELLPVVLRKVEGLKADLDAAELTPAKAVHMARELTQAARMANEALHLALQTEHLAVGAPTEIVGVHDMAMTVEEAVRTIIDGRASLERARMRRTVTLPPSIEAALAVDGTGNGGIR